MVTIDDKFINSLKKFGFRFELSDQLLKINRKVKIPLFVWAYLIVLGLFAVVYSMNVSNIILGLFILFAGLVLYYWNKAFQVVIDKKAATVIFKKGIFRINHYKRFGDVKALELKTYDVPTSASPFEKGNREFIAEIRLLLFDGLPVDLMNFEDRSRDKVEIANNAFEYIITYTGFPVTKSNH